MKKSLLTFIAFSALWVINSSAAHAQSSLLPFTDKKPEECIQILNQFEVDGKIPNAQETEQLKKQVETDKKTQSGSAATEKKADELQKELENKEKAAKESDSKIKEINTQIKTAQEDLQKAKTICQFSDPTSCGDIDAYQQKVSNLEQQLKAAQDENLKNQMAASVAKSEFEKAFDQAQKEGNVNPQTAQNKIDTRDHLLGCAIKTGRISLGMIPYFVSYISNTLLGMVGLVSVLFIVIGGYYYIAGGLTEEKDKGKKTIQHALAGLVLATMAWSIVNVIIGALTG